MVESDSQEEANSVARKVADLIEAVRLTPSCFNNQPWKYLFLESDESLEKGRQALSKGNFAWASRAPLLVIGYARRDDDCVLPEGRVYYQSVAYHSPGKEMQQRVENGKQEQQAIALRKLGAANGQKEAIDHKGQQQAKRPRTPDIVQQRGVGRRPEFKKGASAAP